MNFVAETDGALSGLRLHTRDKFNLLTYQETKNATLPFPPNPSIFCQLNGFVSTSSKQTFNVSEL